MKYRLIGVLLLALALGLSSDAFATPSNLLNVLRQASLVFLSASGLTLVIVGADADCRTDAQLAGGQFDDREVRSEWAGDFIFAADSEAFARRLRGFIQPLEPLLVRRQVHCEKRAS